MKKKNFIGFVKVELLPIVIRVCIWMYQEQSRGFSTLSFLFDVLTTIYC